jgi:glutaminyl-tRNA synthetase
MPAKFDPSNPQVAELIASFESIGLSKSKATDAARNPKSAIVLKELIESRTLPESALDEKTAALVSGLASQCGALGPDERAFVVHAITEGKLKTADQISG